MNRISATEKLLDQMRRSLTDDTFVGLRLGNPSTSRSKVGRVDVRSILLSEGPLLSIGNYDGVQTVTRNYTIEEGLDWIRARLGTQFQNAMLKTTHRDWQLHCPATGEPRLVGHKPTCTSTPSREHDQPKTTLLDSTATDWLHALGITDKSGRAKPSTSDKYRQIRRYVEILHHLARDCGWTARDKLSDGQAPKSTDPALVIADMGCGKGYLTFAAWHLFHRVLHEPASVVGVETRNRLVQEANRIARQVNAEGLEFIAGDIASTSLPKLDALIALHACNTATDDAIRRGIDSGAKLIVVAPCCHQALRPELGNPDLFAPLLRHGLLKERMAEWLTDGLRTLYLEWAGYETKVIEFVASEHTPKNLMIAAIHNRKPITNPAAKRRILELKGFFGVKHHALDELLKAGLY